MEQFNNLIEFRQATYEHGFTKANGCKSQIVNLCHQREREISLNTAYNDGLLVTFAATGG